MAIATSWNRSRSCANDDDDDGCLRETRLLRGYLLGLVKKSTAHETNLKRSYLGGARFCAALLEHRCSTGDACKTGCKTEENGRAEVFLVCRCRSTGLIVMKTLSARPGSRNRGRNDATVYRGVVYDLPRDSARSIPREEIWVRRK